MKDSGRSNFYVQAPASLTIRVEPALDNESVCLLVPCLRNYPRAEIRDDSQLLHIAHKFGASYGLHLSVGQNYEICILESSEPKQDYKYEAASFATWKARSPDMGPFIEVDDVLYTRTTRAKDLCIVMRTQHMSKKLDMAMSILLCTRVDCLLLSDHRTIIYRICKTFFSKVPYQFDHTSAERGCTIIKHHERKQT